MRTRATAPATNSEKKENAAMRYTCVVSAILLAATFGAGSYPAAAAPDAAAGATSVAAPHKKSPPVRRTVRSTTNAVTYNRDSRDPNVGWHTVNGMRQCTQDCDNPEIPGSGYTCRDVNVLGMAMRECDSSSW
jgi:hypothetical protein